MCELNIKIMKPNWALDYQYPTPNGDIHPQIRHIEPQANWLKQRAVQMPEVLRMVIASRCRYIVLESFKTLTQT